MAESAYSSIRRRHLVVSLRTISRRQQTAILLVGAFLGPYSIGFMHGLASGLRTFADPGTSPAWRGMAWGGWFAATSLIVLALREPVFMLAARPFLRMLPISRAKHLACDIRSIAIAYSFLWLPIGYFLWTTWTSQAGMLSKLDGTLVMMCALAASMALQGLSLQPRLSAISLALFGAAACCVAPSAPWPASWLVLASASGLIALALLGGYERAARSRATAAIAAPVASRLAAWSGLAIPVAWRDLKHSLGLRLAWLGAVLALTAWLARDPIFCARRTGFHVVAGALSVIALYPVPAMIDERLRESLPWIFRLGVARRRSIAWSSASTLLLFTAVQAVGAGTWSAECGPLAARPIAISFAVALAMLAALAFRWRGASTWIAILCMAILAFALGEAL